MLVDYKFCLESKLTLKDLFIWLDLDQLFIDDCSDNLFGRCSMLFHKEQEIIISCKHEDFNRWADSEEYCFNINNYSDKRRFVNWVKYQRGLVDDGTKTIRI